MAETKTKPTAVKVKDFIAAIEDDGKRNDAQTLVKMMQGINVIPGIILSRIELVSR